MNDVGRFKFRGFRSGTKIGGEKEQF